MEIICATRVTRSTKVKWQHWTDKHGWNAMEMAGDLPWPRQEGSSCPAPPRCQGVYPLLTVQSAWLWPGAAGGALNSCGSCSEPAGHYRGPGSQALSSRKAASVWSEWLLEGSDAGERGPEWHTRPSRIPQGPQGNSPHSCFYAFPPPIQ